MQELAVGEPGACFVVVAWLMQPYEVIVGRQLVCLGVDLAGRRRERRLLERAEPRLERIFHLAHAIERTNASIVNDAEQAASLCGDKSDGRIDLILLGDVEAHRTHIVHRFETLEVFVFPSAGQAADQQSKDESECYSWASSNTGSDPFELQKQSEQQAQQQAKEQGAAQQQATAETTARTAAATTAVAPASNSSNNSTNSNMQQQQQKR